MLCSLRTYCQQVFNATIGRMKTRVKRGNEEPVLFSIRLPTGTRNQLSEIASAEGRSTNSLIVEFIEDRLKSHRIAKQARENDPLAVAYLSADILETYAQVIRAAILRAKVLSGDFPAVPDEGATVGDFESRLVQSAGAPASLGELTPQERELLESLKNLTPEMQAAMITLAKGKFINQGGES